MGKKNGEINFLRFVFAVIVLILHFEDNYKFFWFRQGYISVEFYFLVSGFLMAKHAKKLLQLRTHPENPNNIANETWKFTIGKIRGFYKYYACVMVLWLVLLQIWLRHGTFVAAIKYILRGLPQITLSFMGLCHDYTGLYVGNTWYLSAMVIAMFMLYPMLLKNFDVSSKVVFPLVSIFLLGYLYKTYNSICMTFEWNGHFYDGVTRAVAEIALGASLFPLTEYLTTKYKWLFESKNVLPRLMLTVLKWGCYGVVFAYAYGLNIGGNFSIHALCFCVIAVTLSFSNAGYMIPDNKVTAYLGKIALPIYIFHGLFRWMCRTVTGVVTIPAREAVLMIVGSLVVSVLLMYVTDYISNLICKLFGKLKNSCVADSVS